MPAARFWRAVGLSAYAGGDVELSEFQLYSSSGDANYANVSLLLHGEGTDGGSTITDSGPIGLSPSSTGAVVTSNLAAKFGTTALKFTAAGDALLYANNSAFNPGTGGFTVEFWFYTGSTSSTQTCLSNYQNSSSGWSIAVTSGGGLGINLSGDAYDITAPGGTILANQWYHIALSGSQGDYRLFVDGVQKGSTFTGSVSMDTTSALGVGGLRFGGVWYDQLTGFLDDVRITKGVARYTENFAPPNLQFPDSPAGTATRVDDAATLSCTLTPVSGSLANLQDDDTSTLCRIDPKPAGFALVWDFGSGNTADVSQAVIGSAASQDRFLSHCDLQYSSNGSDWSLFAQQGRFAWPGANTKTATDASAFIPIPTVLVVGSSVDAAWKEDIEGGVGGTVFGETRTVRDIYNAGRGQIVATVKEDGDPTDTPVRRRVRLFRDRDGLMVRETWSDATTGAYSFTEIDENLTYSVVAYDHNNNFRAVIADRITPTVP